jgi:hypothetical protein
MQLRTETAGPAAVEPPLPLDPAGEELSESLLIARQRDLIHDLTGLVAERARLEGFIDPELESANQTAEERFDSAYQDAIIRFAADKEKAEQDFETARRSIAARYKRERHRAEEDLARARRRSLGQYQTEKEQTKHEFQEVRWTTSALLEGGLAAAEQQLKQRNKRIDEALRGCRATRTEAEEFLAACRMREEPPPQGKVNIGQADPLAKMEEYVSFADWKLVDLKGLALPKLFKGERLLWLVLGLWLLAVYPAFRFLGLIPGLIGSAVAFVLVGLLVGALLYAVARRRVRRLWQPLCQAVAAVENLSVRCRVEAETQSRKQVRETRRRYATELRQAAERYRTTRAASKQRRAEGLKAAAGKYRQLRLEMKTRRETDWANAGETYRQLRNEIQSRYEQDSREVHEKLARRLEENRNRHAGAWERLTNAWHGGLERLRQEAVEILGESAQLFPDWSDAAWASWRPPAVLPSGIRFGRYTLDAAGLPGGLSADERLRTEGPTAFSLPALVDFPKSASLIVEASGEGRPRAVQLLQALVFRLLTALPPGKVRFTIIDPVGLGQNFATFMHLADYDEALISGRIFTEASHIEGRLADLTAHMEKVIQKYLRDLFATIEDYNAQAGEVAEPYRFLVIANFPANFTTEAGRRLLSVLSSGPRCGVYTLLAIDSDLGLPIGFSMKDLDQAGAARLVWEGGRFVWQDPDFAPFPLEVDAPPAAEFCTAVLRQVGERAKEAKRVEVPFEFVAPPPERWWTADSRSGLEVPLGRAGATKRQFLRLGHGTAQHALVAGKTGSGKSTLLHALINNLALLYTPDEVELYLVDFKKGVEFKTYATHGLPHARVVAIESEREFGLSVLQRLDAELRRRGERFRAAGAQDVAGYRQANGDALLPRILLVVDEFQEFFVEDDKIAQEAALLLDRLVRQGRAFGLHVLLGSQTLGGAYSLARSTIDQMAVRIALQCSEADAHLILSEENAAARLLSRPGEAIYNDANGLVEGNNPFQVVWLPEARREAYLREVGDLQRRRGKAAGGQIVFEGNSPADLRRNPLLGELLARPDGRTEPGPALAWLGEAIAIKDPTAATFRAQSGANLLLIGQNEESALGILSAALVSLTAQRRTDQGSRIAVLDGTPEDSPHAGLFGKLASVLPQPIRVAGRRELGELLEEWAQEVERRLAAGGAAGPDWFLCIHGLHRFRDLRRQEDDFGFSRGGEERPNPARRFTDLLREGPAVGVHVLAWCDSLNNVQRTLDRQSLREFELRVLFQMSGTDSSNLIDTPLASRLGVHRALFHGEEEARLEKFRPYGVPDEADLAWLREQFARRGAADGPDHA